MSRLLDNLLIFGGVLRRAGIDVHAGRLAELAEALAYVDLGAQDEVYHACRALLVRRQEQIAIFDLAFAAFWRDHRDRQSGGPARARQSAEPRASVVETLDVLAPEDLDATAGSDDSSNVDQNADDALDDDALTPEARVKTWSDSGALAAKDFAAFTTDELAEARAALSRLVWQPGQRRTRRWVRGRGARVDLRRAIAESLRTGGDVVKLPRRTRRVRPRPLVLLCDVSGSMERY